MGLEKIRRKGASIMLLAAVITTLIGCSGVPAGLSSAAIPLQSTPLTVPATPTAPPTQPLPAVSVYALDENGEAYPAPGSDSQGYPAATSNGLPAPVTVVEINEPVLPTAEPTEPRIETADSTPQAAAKAAADTPPPTVTPAPTFTPPALPQTSNEDHFWFRRPIPEGGVVWTDKFYPYGSTRGGQLRTHHGVEFNVTYDTPVLAAADGVIVHAGPDDGENLVGPEPNFYGTVIVIEHDFTIQGQALFTVYGHLNSVGVTVGQRVRALDQIGLSGATGVADGPHLHFEVRVGSSTYGSTRNPLLWLWPFPGRGTLAGRVVFPGGQDALQAPVQIRRIDGGDTTVFTTTSYADNIVNGDDLLQENFAFDDVPAGYYEVYVKVGEKKYSQEVWVFPRRTALVELVLGEE